MHDHYHTLAEANRISILPIVPNRGIIVDRNGVVLAHQLLRLHAGDHAEQGRRPRQHDRRARDAGRDHAARPPALQEAARGKQALREPADPHAPHRRGDRALRRQPLPLPRRRRARAALPRVSAGRALLARDRPHRPHQPEGPRPARSRRAASPTTAAPTTSARPASSTATRTSCTARPASSRSKSIPAAARCARSRARRRSRAATSCSSSTRSCRKSSTARSAIAAARSSRSSPRRAACSRS